MAEENTEKTAEKKEIKAKTVSMLIKIFDVVFIVTFATLKWSGVLKEVTIGEVCAVAGVIAAIFGDVSVNTALDKFKKTDSIQ